MSINEPAAPALLPRFSGESMTTANAGAARRTSQPGFGASLHDLDAALGSSGRAAILIALALAVVVAGWAIWQNVSSPLAVTAGFCMLAAVLCAWAALRVIASTAERAEPISPKVQPNHAAWKIVKRLRVSDASRLWCDIEPGCPASQESLAWARAMADAIKRGELAVSKRPGENPDAADRERANPNWSTEIDRDALASWAKSHGHAPRFLQH